jgi:probable rRNA maturation factor
MSISYIVEGVRKPKLRFRLISTWLKQIIGKYDRLSGDITYVFCSDEYLKTINVKYLSHDYYTDIVTFDYCTENIVSGDMLISVERVKENSVLFKSDIDDEFLRVMVHGLLHLIGFNDGTDPEVAAMRKNEDECIMIFKEICNECIK